jgi:transposase
MISLSFPPRSSESGHRTRSNRESRCRTPLSLSRREYCGEYGCDAVFSEMALSSCAQEGVDVRHNSLDSTSFSLTGTYDVADDEQAMQITYGHSKDHRPDLKQAVEELLVSQDGGIPLFMKIHDGNASDSRILRRHQPGSKRAV